MPRKCSICGHPLRLEIDKAVATGREIRATSVEFRVSEDALTRHKEHIGRAIVRAAERRESSLEDQLLAKLDRIESRLWKVLDRMEKEGDNRGAVVALRELRASVDSMREILMPQKQQKISENHVLIEVAEMMRSARGKPRLPTPVIDAEIIKPTQPEGSPAPGPCAP